MRQLRMMLRFQRLMLAIMVPAKPETRAAATIAAHGKQLAYLQQQVVQANSALTANTANTAANYQTLLDHTATLADHTTTLAADATTLTNHTTILNAMPNYAFLGTLSKGAYGTTAGYTFPGTYDGGVGEQYMWNQVQSLISALAAANIVI